MDYGADYGKVDLSGVWVPASTLLPSDPSYQPWAKKIYDERKANKGRDDPESVCLPDGGADMNLIERYRRPDLGHLKVDLTIEDPKAFTKPYSFTRTFTLAPNWDLQEYVCHAILDGIE